MFIKKKVFKILKTILFEEIFFYCRIWIFFFSVLLRLIRSVKRASVDVFMSLSFNNIEIIKIKTYKTNYKNYKI